MGQIQAMSSSRISDCGLRPYRIGAGLHFAKTRGPLDDRYIIGLLLQQRKHLFLAGMLHSLLELDATLPRGSVGAWQQLKPCIMRPRTRPNVKRVLHMTILHVLQGCILFLTVSASWARTY